MNPNQIFHLDYIAQTHTFFYPINKFSWRGGCRARCNSFRRRSHLFRRDSSGQVARGTEPKRELVRGERETKRVGEGNTGRKIPRRQKEEGESEGETDEETTQRQNPRHEAVQGTNNRTLKSCWRSVSWFQSSSCLQQNNGARDSKRVFRLGGYNLAAE